MAIKRKLDIAEEFVKWFSELSNKDISIAGGKGASLSEMYNEEFPVPPGFIVTAQAFDYFIKQNNLKEKIKSIIESIDMEKTAELEKRAKEIRKMVEDQEIPEELENEILEAYHILSSEKIERTLGVSQDALNILKNSQEPAFVAVRSSATTEDLGAASFAGAGESFVNTKGDYMLLQNLKKCFSSLYTARAIYYRKKQGFGVEKVDSLLAVVIQKMVDSEKSGVVFSKDPIKLDDNIIVEAVFGLGEGIVSGEINPDNYVVSRDLEIKSIRLSNKKIALVRNGSGENIRVKLNPEKANSRVLTNGEILKLADYAIKLEEHYKKPQDIEFAVEQGKVYIVQSRPITTLGEKQKSEKEITGKLILSGSGASPGIGIGTVRIIKSMDDLSKIKKGDVMVTEMTNPDMVVDMQKSTAIVTDEGGMTSHAAIVSREMGIPCVVGTGNATTTLKEGMKITVDGKNGKVYEGEIGETTLAEIKPIVETNKIKLKLILDLPDFAERAAQSRIENIGLVRLEGIIAESGKHPLAFEKENNTEEYSEVIRKGIEKISEHFKSVWVRSSDIRTDEFNHLKGAPEKELNPMLGFHGIRFSLKHPKIFEAELAAIKKVAEKNPNKKFGVMFPQVILLEEVKQAKEYFNKYKTENMEFGVMIETPAAVQIIDEICQQGINFISFGTNDLTQFTLAIDRGNEDVQYLYNELNPAIYSQIKRVIGACKRNRVQSSICGQAGSKKEMVEFLFKQGINSISVNADAAYDVSMLIKKLEEESLETKPEHPKHENQNPNQNTIQKIINKIPLMNDKKGELAPLLIEKENIVDKYWQPGTKQDNRPSAEPEIKVTEIKQDNETSAEPEIKVIQVKQAIDESIPDSQIEPMDNLSDLTEEEKDIQERVQAKNDWLLIKDKQIEDNIEVEEQKVNEIEQDDSQIQERMENNETNKEEESQPQENQGYYNREIENPKEIKSINDLIEEASEGQPKKENKPSRYVDDDFEAFW